MLTLRVTKPVRVEWSDGDMETTVVLDPGDDQETLVRKLRKVLALVEGGQGKAALEKYTQALRQVEESTRPQGGDALTGAVAAQPGNGWKALYEPPEVPERLKGEVELIGEEEAP